MADTEKNDSASAENVAETAAAAAATTTTNNANNSTENNATATETNECKTVSNNNWWGSWINSAKSKSVSVLEAVKRDLNEISTTVRTEVSYAGNVLNDTLKLDEPESTASTVKKSLSSFFGQVSEALAPTLEDDDAEAVLITSNGAVTLTGFQKHLAELQANEATYLSPPDSSLSENYQRWLEIVEQDQFTQNQLAKHLTNSEILNEKYLSLVPEKVPHMEFWKRYLFKRALLEDALAHAEIAERRAKAEMRSTQTVSPKRATEIIQTEQPKTVMCDNESDADKTPIDEAKPAAEELVIEDTDIKWEAEDFGSEEISEEEQARLLEEYEAEIQEREKRKSQIVPLEEKLQKQATKKDQPAGGKKQQSTQKNTGANKKTNATKSTSKQVDNSKNKSTTKPNQSTSAQSNSNKDNKNTKSDKSAAALRMQKNHFDDAKDAPVVKSLAEDLKDLKTDTGSASDESWEKDFDLSDRDQ